MDCNAVIVARPGSEFLSLWQQKYESFNPNICNLDSVRIPKRLHGQSPETVCPLSPTVFFWPTWAKRHVRYMHRDILSSDEVAELEADMDKFGGAMYEDQLAYHATNAHEFLTDLTDEEVLARDTRFNVLVREIATAPL
jgi:hypothetical protein